MLLKVFLQQAAQIQFVIHDQQFHALELPLELPAGGRLTAAASLMSLR